MTRPEIFKSPAVVGTIHSSAALAHALRLKERQVDFLELRLDRFLADLDPVRRALPKLRAPLIVTVRHPAEGGAGGLDMSGRRKLYLEFLPAASHIDVELRSVGALAAMLDAARNREAGIILSHHRFDATPSLGRLLGKLENARAAGADIFKLATVTRTAADLTTLISLLGRRRPSDPHVSAMGMGAFGKISRLALARAGSVLNYGHLGEPQVSGQWPALLLRRRLAELAD